MLGISISVLVSLNMQIFLEVLEGREGLGWAEKKGKKDKYICHATCQPHAQ